MSGGRAKARRGRRCPKLYFDEAARLTLWSAADTAPFFEMLQQRERPVHERQAAHSACVCLSQTCCRVPDRSSNIVIVELSGHCLVQARLPSEAAAGLPLEWRAALQRDHQDVSGSFGECAWPLPRFSPPCIHTIPSCLRAAPVFPHSSV